MITDALLQLASAQAVTTTAVSANTIDLGVQRDIGAGECLYMCITVDETVTAAGAATVEFQPIMATNAGLSSANVLCSTGPIAKAELSLNRRPIFIEIAPTVADNQALGKRYLGMNFLVATGGPLTAGKFSVTLVTDRQDILKYYPSGFTVA